MDKATKDRFVSDPIIYDLLSSTENVSLEKNSIKQGKIIEDNETILNNDIGKIKCQIENRISAITTMQLKKNDVNGIGNKNLNGSEEMVSDPEKDNFQNSISQPKEAEIMSRSICTNNSKTATSNGDLLENIVNPIQSIEMTNSVVKEPFMLCKETEIMQFKNTSDTLSDNATSSSLIKSNISDTSSDFSKNDNFEESSSDPDLVKNSENLEESDSDPVVESSIDMTYYSTTEDLLTSITEPDSSINCSSIHNVDYEEQSTILTFDKTNKKSDCQETYSLDDTDKTLMNNENDCLNATIEDSFRVESDDIVVKETSVDCDCVNTAINKSSQDLKIDLANKPISIVECSETNDTPSVLGISNIESNFSQNNIDNLYTTGTSNLDSKLETHSNSGKLNNISSLQKPASIIKLKSCEVQLGNSRINNTIEVSKPNFLKLKRKLMEMIESSEKEESEVIDEIRKMNEQRRNVHTNIDKELKRIKLKIEGI